MPPAAEPAPYLMPFFLIGFPMLVAMAVMAVIAVRKKSKAGAIILGAVFLLTAGSMLVRDLKRLQTPAETLTVLAVILACGIGGLVLIALSFRFRPPPPGPPDHPRG